MILKIDTSLNFGNIFGKTLAFPMDCELDISKEYYLIYSNLKVDKNQLDLSKLFNDTFDINLPLNISIQEGGFFSFSSRSSTHSGNVVINDIFPSAPISSSVKKNSTPVQSTTTFWATFDLETSGLFKTLIETGYGQSNSVSDVSLSGTFSSGELASETIQTTEYTAKINNFRLIHLFDFKNLELKYRFVQADEYYIEGIVSVELFHETYTFAGNVLSNDTALKACIRSASSDAQVAEPFDGLMKGVTFKDLMFGLSCTYKTDKKKGKSLVRIQGKIDYPTEHDASADSLLTGQIFLDGSKPIVAAMRVGDELDIAAIFNNSIAKGNVWPEKFINIVFHRGTQLYYSVLQEGETYGLTDETFNCTCTGQQDTLTQLKTLPNDITYKKGFHVYARFDITILITIQLVGSIAIRDNGVEAEIQLVNPIDLWILQLVSPSESLTISNTAGPVFRFDSEKSAMGFECGVRFFNTNFGLDTAIEATKDKRAPERTALSGYIESAENHLPFLPKGAKLHFIYNSQEGFQIRGWEEFSLMEDVLDFAKEVQKYSNSKLPPSCGAIVDFAMNEATDTDYRITPRFETVDVNGESKLYIYLDGSYTLYLGKGEHRTELFTLDFPDTVAILVKKELSFDNFGTYISEAIKEAGESFAEGIIDNSEAIAMLLAVFAGKKAGRYATTLCCKKLTTDPKLPEAASAGASAYSGTGGSGGAGGTGLGILIVMGVIGGILGAGGSGGGSGRHPRRDTPEQPTNLKLSIHKNLVTATWAKVEHIDHYQSKFSFNGISPIIAGELSASDTSQSFTIGEEKPAGAYFYQIESIKKGKSSGFVTVCAVKPLPPQLQVSVNTESFQQEDIELVFAWSEVEQTDTYLLFENGSIRELSGDEPRRATSSFSNTHAAGIYYFKMSAQSCFYIQTAFTQEQQWTRLSPPSTIEMSRKQNALNIRWGEESTDSTTLLARVTFKQSETNESITIFKSVDNQSYITVEIPDRAEKEKFDLAFASIRTLTTDESAQEIPSVWSDSVWHNLTPLLTPEQIAKQSFDANESGTNCAHDIFDVYPDIVSDNLAKAMNQGGYPAWDTFNGLVSSYPNASHQTLIQALITAYGENADTLKVITQWCFDQGDSGHDCASVLISSFDNLTPSELTEAMANSGYLADQARNGLKVAFPSLTARQVAQLLTQTYGKDENTPLAVATECFEAGMSGQACGLELREHFRDASPLIIGQVMAETGYNHSQTGLGINAFAPQLSAREVSRLLTDIFGKEETTPQAMAVQAYQAGQTGKECGDILREYDATLTLDIVASSMADAGYDQKQTTQGLRTYKPSIKAVELAHLLKQHF